MLERSDTRQALVVGVEGKSQALTDEAPDALPRLDYASEYAQRVRDLLRDVYNYSGPPEDLASTPTARALETAVFAVLRDGPGFAIVHVLAHGEVGGSSGFLYVVGEDGVRTERSIEHWLAHVEDASADAAPTVLFLLDLCYAGGPARVPWQQLLQTQRRRAWVIGACQPFEPSYNGWLSQSVIEVLEGFHDGTLALDSAFEYIPFERFCREVATSVAARAADAGVPQEITAPLAPVGSDLSDLKFFCNPRFRNDRRSLRHEVDVSLVSLLDESPNARLVLDEIADERHFVGRGSGADFTGDQPSRTVGHFRGRQTEAERLSRWTAGEGPNLLVVTGKPGAGKSALLGVLVCAAHPALRSRTQTIWATLGTSVPPVSRDLAVVHARQRSLPEIAAALGRQWDLVPPEPAQPWTGRTLAQQVALRASAPTLILDALDEADAPSELIESLVAPLLSSHRPDGSPICRVMVGSRKEAALSALLALAADHGEIVDLDAVPRATLIVDLTAYIQSLLDAEPAFSSHENWSHSRLLATSVASALVYGPASEETPLPQEWGEFLVARLYIRHVINSRQVPAGTQAVHDIAAQVPRTLSAVLDLELTNSRNPWFLPTLTALAHGHGEGMPERITQIAARAFRIFPENNVDTPSIQEIRDVFQEARFFLRRNVDTDGSPLYRLFHQGLADALKARSAVPRVPDPRSGQQLLWSTLLDSVARDAHGRREWATTEPYLLRHAARHARDALALDDVLGDAEYLVHADPEKLASTLRYGGQMPIGAAVYRASYGAHHAGSTVQRRQVLAVDAARYDALTLSAALSGPTLWSIVWAAGRPLSRGLDATLTGHDGVTSLAIVETRGKTHVLSASENGTVRLWLLETGETALDLELHPGAVTCVATYTLDNRPHAITGCADGQLRLWDLTNGNLVRRWQAHPDSIRSLTATLDGTVIVSGARGVLRTWDSTSGGLISTLQVGKGPVLSLGILDVEGRPHVSGSIDGIPQIWDLNSKTSAFRYPPEPDARRSSSPPIHVVTPFSRDQGPRLLLADVLGNVSLWDPVRDKAMRIDSAGYDVTKIVLPSNAGNAHAIGVGTNGVAQVWDLETLAISEVLAGHTTPITAVALRTGGTHYQAVTSGSRGTIRVWRLISGIRPVRTPPQRRLGGHARQVQSVVAGKGACAGFGVSTGVDGDLHVWDLASGESRRVPLDAWVHSATWMQWRGKPAILAACGDKGAVIADPATGTTLRSIVLPHAVYAIADASTDAEWRAAFGGNAGCISLWGQETNEALRASAAPLSAITSLSAKIYPGGLIVAAVDDSGQVHVTSPRKKQLPRRVVTFEGRINRVLLTSLAEQPCLLTCGEDPIVHVNTLDGVPVHELIGHEGEVTAIVETSVRGRPYILTGGTDRTMRLWDFSSGQQVDHYTFPDSVLGLDVTHTGAVLIAMGPEVLLMRPDPLDINVNPEPSP
ncbi:hypothetical protein [Embleya sp. NPDC059237]|uniref:hypothetical protein n=1 Tax=Embleya sp. NPDC059237 TaxID=3346784 RepID=UPI0036BDFB5A